ncbi:MAG: hypothetical protein KGS60_01720 [Verrucomicrobia bacterium]|nr:hypothetical protein [Verrucomicrobiota bacterium]
MRVYRPEPEPGDEPAIYLAREDLPGEIWRGVEIALSGFVPTERLFFEGGEGEWEGWCARDFGGGMAPKIIAAREMATRGVKEWALVDGEFGAGRGGLEAASRSLRAGRALAQRHNGARQFQMQERLRRSLEGDPVAGHAATVVAFLSAQFNVATTACLVACLFLEWRAAFPRRPEQAFGLMTPRLGELLPIWLGSRVFPALQSPPED